MIEEMDVNFHELREPNPLPSGGRAALGTAAGLSFATLAAAAWSRLQEETWDPDPYPTRRSRARFAGILLAGSTVGAIVGSQKGTRKAAVVGGALGIVVSQIPLILDPAFVTRHPVLGNIWQYGLPVAGAVLGVNAVSS